jgi:ABC-type sugar transport system substrate-binding protein
MKKLIVSLLSALMVLSVVAGCSAPASDEPAPAATQSTAVAAQTPTVEAPKVEADVEGKTIAFCYQDLETEFWVAGHAAITQALKDAGCEVLEYNANEDANKQLEQVRDAIAAGADGIIIIPQDGESAVTIAKECNRSNVPIGVFNRPPSDDSANNIVIVADNKAIAEACVDYMVSEAKKKFDATGKKLTPLIMVGDLGDPNAVYRKEGFYAAIAKEPDIFNDVIEVDTKWDADTALTNLTAAMQANPDVDFLFTSSDFLFPVIKSVLEPMGKWKKVGEEGHVIMGGLDGDSSAGALIDEGYVDGTGVQDVYYEAYTLLDALLKAIANGETQPDEWLYDPGFALTQANLAERHDDMWGNKLR